MEKVALTFGAPLWLLALALLPVLAALFFWAQRRREALIARVVAPRLKQELVGAMSLTRRWLKNFLILFSLGCIILALAEPRYGYSFREIKARGRDVIIAMDTSRSMLATDISPNRLTRAKLVALDLVRLIQGDRIGIVAFAGSAFLQAPLTLDYTAVESAIDELDTNIIPRGGTDIAAAIRMSLEAFGKAEGATRAIVLITDGEELDANGVAAAKEAEKQGVRIFTVGVGSATGSVIPVEAEGGGTDLVRDEEGKTVHSKLDAARLKEIAAATKGFYEPLGSDTAKDIVTKGIEPMESKEFGALTSRTPIERFEWILGPGILALIAALVLGDRRRNGKHKSHRRVSAAALAAGLLMVASVSSHAQTNPGVKNYNNQDYKSALGNFEKDITRMPDTSAIQFDAGTAAYKLGDYDKAISYFTKAILSDDRKLRDSADYNLGNAFVRKGEKAQQKEQKISNWKDAIQHYGEVLKRDPGNVAARHNKEIVEQMLKDLEKEQKQQQQKDQKDQQKNDQQNKQDKQQDKQNQDKQQQQQQQNQQQNQQDNQQDKQQDKQQQGQQQQNQDKQQQKDQKDQKGNTSKDQQQNQQKNQQQPDKTGNEPQPSPSSTPGSPSKGDQKQQPAAPTPTPGEKKTGDLKANQQEEQKPTPEEKGEAASAAEEKEGKDGNMTAAQAKALLRSLQGDEEKVKLMDRQVQEEVNKNW